MVFMEEPEPRVVQYPPMDYIVPKAGNHVNTSQKIPNNPRGNDN